LKVLSILTQKAEILLIIMEFGIIWYWMKIMIRLAFHYEKVENDVFLQSKKLS
jgi:hypothetical protein